MEVIIVLANCGSDTSKARQALTKYIARKQEKGRSTEHILKKLRQLELKFINDTSLHAAFRDARANTCLPRSPDVPLPEFVLREMAATAGRDSRQSGTSAPRDLVTPSPGPSTPLSWLQPSYSPILRHVDPAIIEEDRIQPEASSRRPSLPPTNAPGRLPVLSPYASQIIGSGRSRSSTVPSSSMSSLFTHSPKKFRTSFNSPPPTSPLPDLPLEAADDYDSHIPRFHLPPPANRPFSSASKSSSSSHSSYPSPRTPDAATTLCPRFSSQSAAMIQGDASYPPRKEENVPQQPPVIMEHCPQEMDIPSMFTPSREGSFVASENSGSDFPVPYRDSPILHDRPTSHNQDFSFPLDNALRLCTASPVVRREVNRCLHQDPGYEQHNWPTVLQECDVAEDEISFLLNEIAREMEFTLSMS